MAEIILPKGEPMEDIGTGIPGYSWEQFEADIAKIKPRVFDIYILGPFMIYFAMKSKKGMGRWTRRMLFTAGLYTVYRNWQSYKTLPETVRAGMIPAIQSKENTNGML